MPMDIRVGDILELKKTHPCGCKEWKALRVGMDFKLRCALYPGRTAKGS